jgi:hypothetical protein
MALVPTATWPTILGNPRVEGYRMTFPTYFTRQKMQSGVARYRRKSWKLVTFLDVSFWWDSQQFEAFENFYYVIISEGFDPFRMPLVTTYGLVNQTVRMSPYTYRNMDQIQANQVDFQVYYLPPTYGLTPPVSSLLAAAPEAFTAPGVTVLNAGTPTAVSPGLVASLTVGDS